MSLILISLLHPRHPEQSSFILNIFHRQQQVFFFSLSHYKRQRFHIAYTQQKAYKSSYLFRKAWLYP